VDVKQRITEGKLTFRYTERPYKTGRWKLLNPRVFKAAMKERTLDGRSHHLLAVGPHCAEDYRFIQLFHHREWKWGYFPDATGITPITKSGTETIVLWAGRMLAWKHIDLLLHAASWARAHRCAPFRLRIIGYGPEDDKLRLLMANLGLADICEFCGPQSPDAVGLEMEKADIYVFPSDTNEGWGVVVNEAMTRGCCVIGSNMAGAVPWLIHDGENGLILKRGDALELGQLLMWCVDHPKERQQMGEAAQKTISQLWSPSIAAERFLGLSESLMKGKGSPYHDSGPCSPA
jgi:glycosyltransferase involved in cell wall biosynthesis